MGAADLLFKGRKMHTLTRRVVSTVCLALLASTAGAQSAPAKEGCAMGPGAGMERGHAEHGHKVKAERHAQHLEKLKAQLQLQPAQEAAWAQFVARSQPPVADKKALPDWATMTTPQRLDAMQALHTARAQAMQQHGEAMKALYASLNAAQKKVLDAHTLPGAGRHARHGRHAEMH